MSVAIVGTGRGVTLHAFHEKLHLVLIARGWLRWSSPIFETGVRVERSARGEEPEFFKLDGKAGKRMRARQ
jgi:hypothetical protein